MPWSKANWRGAARLLAEKTQRVVSPQRIWLRPKKYRGRIGPEGPLIAVASDYGYKFRRVGDRARRVETSGCLQISWPNKFRCVAFACTISGESTSTFPCGKLTVITGVSGAGKSSLAFDTLYAEAQRRYLQSFSAYTRQFLERLDQPDADFLGDLPPAIAVSQRSLAQGPRATVGTVTEIFDYLRLFLARFGSVHCREMSSGSAGPQSRRRPGRAGIVPDRHPAQHRFSRAARSGSEPAADRLAGLKEEGFVRAARRDHGVSAR